MIQTDLAVARFRRAYPDRETEIRVISTRGDVDKQSPLTEIGGRGVFTSAIESAIVAGEVDAGVHSAKDLPTALHAAAPIVAFPSRDDPRDVLVTRHGVTLDRLPRNPVIGTSSRRRAVQIARLRPDARIVNVRGNIDTRLRKAEGSEFDAIVLAAAGLHRMGWSDRVSQYFSVEEVVPSPAQGAIAIQARRESDSAAMLEAIDDAAVSRPVGIERAFLAAVGAGCAFPAGAHAAITENGVRLIAMLATETGERVARADEVLVPGNEYAHATALAVRLRAEIELAPIPRSWNGSAINPRDLDGARVVVTRPRRQAAPLVAALRERGGIPILLPIIRVEPIADTSALDTALSEAKRGAFDWIVFTSANAVEAVANRIATVDASNGQLMGVSVAAIGKATADAAAAVGLNVQLVPETAAAETVAAALIERVRPGSRMLYPRSAIGRDVLPDALRMVGMHVDTVAVYETLPESEIEPCALEQVRRAEFDLIVFASPSSVRHFVNLLGEDAIALECVRAVCAGPVTARAASDAGFSVVAVSAEPGAVSMTDAAATYWQTKTGHDDRTHTTTAPMAAASAHALGRSSE